MARFNTKGSPPKPVLNQTKGEPPAKVSDTLTSSDDNEQSESTNVTLKVPSEQAKQFRSYYKLIGKGQTDVFLEGFYMHKKAHADELKAAMDTL